MKRNSSAAVSLFISHRRRNSPSQLQVNPYKEGTPGVTGYRSEVLAEVMIQEDKFTRLAEAIPAEKYTWRPAPDVRSFAEVFLHVSAANYNLYKLVGIASAAAGLDLKNLEKSTTNKAKVIATLKDSFAHAKKAITAMPDADLDKSMDWFGGKNTERGILLFIVRHAAEHLGQSIAYARFVRIVPPWTEDMKKPPENFKKIWRAKRQVTTTTERWSNRRHSEPRISGGGRDLARRGAPRPSPVESRPPDLRQRTPPRGCARFEDLMDLAPTICTQALTRRFGELIAVDGIDLRVAPGQFFGFLGPNGAGKSTTIKMLTGLLAPSSGQIEILGIDLNAHPVEVKRQIGVVPEGMALFGRLTGAEFLSFAGRMYGLDRTTAAKRAAELLEFMQLADQPKKLVTDYSHGMQKKLALAAAVIHGPKVLFLDEPFEGVDAIAAGTLKSMLQGMIARGATIFLTSHVLEIVERLCSHVAIIHQGRLVAQGSLEELRAGVEAQTPAGSGDGAEPSGEKLTLEELFLRIVGGTHRTEQELSWLG